MKHLKHVLSVIAPLVAAGAAAAAASPAWRTFLEHHGSDAGYVALGAGVLRAVYKAATAPKASGFSL